MASDVVVPEVGEVGMEVVFVRWLKAEGDEVAVGEPLFEVDTEKSVMEVEAYAAGTLTGLEVGEGDTVQTRQVIARILAPGEEPAPAALADDREPSPTSEHPGSGASGTPTDHVSPLPGWSPGTADSSSAVPATSPAPVSAPRRAGVSPRARRVAKQLGVDTAALVGSGSNGLITEADVRAAAAAERAHVAAPQTGSTASPDPADRARRAIADLTTRSWQSIPHFYLQLQADVETGLGLSKPTPLICAAVAHALQRHPECNLAWDADKPIQRDGVDLGLLVDAPAGLLIAVITNAQDLDLVQMADAIREAAGRARSGTLGAADMGTRSLTISNLGMYAVDRFSAVIPRPDVLTLAVGRTRTLPHWDGTSFVPRQAVELTLSVDHRALDGAAAARFLSTVESVLADPAAEGLA
jgi:pyruvate dehydrogenase E2 component (dihydrolipoamide acetyltransferase)